MEQEPVWLTSTDAYAIHHHSIGEFGGAPGVRDAGLLESAISRPQHLFHYGTGVTLHRLAASYCFGIVRNHPFIDGNKRTGYIAARVFLRLNGIVFDPPQGEPTSIIRSLAAGELTEEALAAWIERNAQVRPQP